MHRMRLFWCIFTFRQINHVHVSTFRTPVLLLLSTWKQKFLICFPCMIILACDRSCYSFTCKIQILMGTKWWLLIYLEYLYGYDHSFQPPGFTFYFELFNHLIFSPLIKRLKFITSSGTKELIRNAVTSDNKLTCKPNSRNSYIVAKHYRVSIHSVMRSSTNSENPRTEGRHALGWWPSIACCLHNKNASLHCWEQSHVYGIKKCCKTRRAPVGSDW